MSDALFWVCSDAGVVERSVHSVLKGLGGNFRDLDPAIGTRRPQRLVVALVLVGVGLGEGSNRLVEGVALAEVGGDRDAVAAAGVGVGQGGTADLGVGGEGGGVHALDLCRALLVPELAHVE